YGFSPVAGGMGDRREFGQAGGAAEVASARTAESVEHGGSHPPGAETSSGLAEIARPRLLQASGQEPKIVGRAGVSAETARAPVETQFERIADHPTPARVAAKPARSLRERLRRPLMFALPIVLAMFGTGYYFAEEPYVSTDDAFVRAAKITINARVAGQA